MTVQLHSRFFEVARPAGKTKSKPPRPISIRVTREERARLEREAGERTLSAYIRMRLFGAKDHRGPDRKPSIETAALARVLGILGKSGIATNMVAVAQSARDGTLECGPELLGLLERACLDIADMRRELIRALGIKPE